MSESALLRLVVRYPHRVAIARRVNGVALNDGIRRLERAGLVVRRRDVYRVTKSGRTTLEFDHALHMVVRRAQVVQVTKSLSS
jgi:hypothetical protein